MILLTLRIKCKVKGWYYEKVNKKNFRTIKKQTNTQKKTKIIFLRSYMKQHRKLIYILNTKTSAIKILLMIKL